MENYLVCALLSFVFLFTGSTIIDTGVSPESFHWWVGILAIFAGIGCAIAFSMGVYTE
jgi:hypothetical protein